MRHPTPLEPNAGTIISVLGCLSMGVNICLATWMAGSGGGCGHNHGTGGTAVGMAVVHIVCDVGQNAIVIITGVVLWIWPHFYAVDPICLLFFLALLLLSTLPRICEILCVLLEAAPRDVDCEQLRRDLLKIKDVTHVRDFHAWSITPGKTAVAAHLYTKDSPEDALVAAETMIMHKYGIRHCTLRVCDDDPCDAGCALCPEAPDPSNAAD
uniref:Uncharacterized protein n=1 Tax=Pyrodinium bahamense TaxID=73915 RepID=A0A7S0B1K6_9DINO